MATMKTSPRPPTRPPQTSPRPPPRPSNITIKAVAFAPNAEPKKSLRERSAIDAAKGVGARYEGQRKPVGEKNQQPKGTSKSGGMRTSFKYKSGGLVTKPSATKSCKMC